ncbi:hypothetical protein AR158_c266L [Paramecium bursaria Chlorella virus AR158]|uniref:hypothetical protein n=1 Tax=Paramecium bursaria Chlorella virus AR158 TaxID=380598 RepID=UPI00015AA8DA|nr:hypothetical protein AR158_c266L [Paramecium bursaria Chlorella virus AR158]ABU43811.1 hypothetical protein AR158_c266L [Paramecium bursaria Chlorella virus AR158]
MSEHDRYQIETRHHIARSQTCHKNTSDFLLCTYVYEANRHYHSLRHPCGKKYERHSSDTMPSCRQKGPRRQAIHRMFGQYPEPTSPLE